MNINIPKIERIAKKARNDFENKKIDKNLLGKLYMDYNPVVEDINSFIEQATENFPDLNCGLASVYLRSMIPQSKVINGSYENENHTFLFVKCVVVVDITSDQYGGPKVYVGPLRWPWSLEN